MMKENKNDRTYTLHYTGTLLGEMESQKLVRAIMALIDGGVRHLVLDMTQVKLVNTPGAFFLAEMWRTFDSIHGSFAVSHAESGSPAEASQRRQGETQTANWR